jgi:iron complex outermembrane receptor protein
VKRWLAILLLAPALATAGSLKPLAAADVPALLAPPAHGERLIALWALDCAYCEPNLQALARLQQAHPQAIELVTVATDDVVHRDAIEKRLRAAGMSAWPARAYADSTPERLNYLIDPDWGGETPRVLVIRADGSHQGFSGELTPKQLQALAPPDTR